MPAFCAPFEGNRSTYTSCVEGGKLLLSENYKTISVGHQKARGMRASWPCHLKSSAFSPAAGGFVRESATCGRRNQRRKVRQGSLTG